jgi:hypothetical protein
MGTFDAVKKEWKLKGKQGTIKATVRKLAQYFDVTLEATEEGTRQYWLRYLSETINPIKQRIEYLEGLIRMLEAELEDCRKKLP